MKLKPVMKKGLVTATPKQSTKETTPKTSRKKQENTLPSDEYRPMFPPLKFLVRETFSAKNPTKVIKQYVELSVKRFGEDEENQPMVYIQMYQESEFYTGYLKGKTVFFPLESLYEIIDGLNDLSEECDKRKIE